MTKRNSFGMKAFGIRFIYLFVLIFLTYNPSHYSLIDWMQYELTSFSIGIGMIIIILWCVVLWFVYLGSDLRGG